MAFDGNRLYWPVHKTVRSFRVYVVEPYQYAPEEHAGVFNAAINSLLSPPIQELGDFSVDKGTPPEVEPFDLITFPEAFLPMEDLLGALRLLARIPQCGCVHVGLRPTSGEQHLFGVSELQGLVEKIGEIPLVEKSDLSAFSIWLNDQVKSRLFNVACLFAIDANKKIRVCLHPKVIRSKFEIGMLHETNMAEANLLTLVSLIPKDRRHPSVTLQPLICSDGLNGDTDRPGARPIYAVNEDGGDCFKEGGTDHVDFVSLATCTPQPTYGAPPNEYAQWHPAFQETFSRVGSDDGLWKHHQAIFVLSNFYFTPGEKPGGLSGGFIPVPFPGGQMPDYLAVSAWGYPEANKRPDGWSSPNEKIVDESAWKSYGYIASLRSPTGKAARMIGFAVNKLPRQSSRWRSHSGLTDFQLFVASIDNSSSRLTFKRQVA